MPSAFRILLLVVVALIGARIASPELVERYVNGVIDRTEGYDGRIEDVDLALWRGGYSVEGLRLDHEVKEELRPLIAADRIDLALQWGPLLRGELVGEVDVRGLVYNIVAAPPESEEVLSQSGEEPELSDRLSELLPVSVNRFEVHGGEVHYRDPHRSPPVDVALTEVQLLARNWSNAADRSGERFGRAWLRARAFQSARFAASLEADPLASPPHFALAAVSEGIALTELNRFLRAYGGFDAAEGQLSVYLEVEAEGGRFEGYIKPLVAELDVLGAGDEDDPWTDRLWEGAVGLVAEVFENQPAGRQATRIPLEGSFGEARPDLASTLGYVLYNAFIKALAPRLEHPEHLTVRSDPARRAD